MNGSTVNDVSPSTHSDAPVRILLTAYQYQRDDRDQSVRGQIQRVRALWCSPHFSKMVGGGHPPLRLSRDYGDLAHDKRELKKIVITPVNLGNLVARQCKMSTDVEKLNVDSIIQRLLEGIPTYTVTIPR